MYGFLNIIKPRTSDFVINIFDSHASNVVQGHRHDRTKVFLLAGEVTTKPFTIEKQIFLETRYKTC